MRLSKIFSIVALSALTLPVFAQTITRIAGFDTSRPNWWNADYSDVAGIVYDPTQDSVVVPMYIDLVPDQNWVRLAPNPGRWATWAVTFIYNPRYFDILAYRSDETTLVRFSEVATPPPANPADPGAFLAPNIAAATFVGGGIASGGISRLSDGRIKVTLVIAATANLNGDRTNSSGRGFGYMRHPFKRQYGPSVDDNAPEWAQLLPLIELKPRLIAQEVGSFYDLEISIQREQFINKIGSGPGEGRFGGPYGLQARFLVPEPASMIALGSGLVGLLALRRRKK